MRQLHPEAIAAIQSKALFSQAEEALLAKISSVSTSLYFAVVLTNQIIFFINIAHSPSLNRRVGQNWKHSWSS